MSTTPELDGFFASLLKDSFIPNIYDYILPEDYDSVDMPDRFQKSKYSYPLVLDTFGHSLSIWIAIGFVLIVASLLGNSSIGCLNKISTKIRQILLYNGLIRIALETSIYIFLGCFLNFKYGFVMETHSITNFVCSCLLMTVLAGFAAFCYYAIKMNKGVLGEG